MLLSKKIFLKKKFLEQLFRFTGCLNIFGNHSIRMKYLFSLTFTFLVCVAMGQSIPMEFINREAFTISRDTQKLSELPLIHLPQSAVDQLVSLPQGNVNGTLFNGQIQPSNKFQSFRIAGTDVIVTVQNTARLERMYQQSQKKNAAKK